MRSGSRKVGVALRRVELLLGDDVLMLDRAGGDRDARHLADALRPDAGGVDDDLAADRAVVGDDGLDAPAASISKPVTSTPSRMRHAAGARRLRVGHGRANRGRCSRRRESTPRRRRRPSSSRGSAASPPRRSPRAPRSRSPWPASASGGFRRAAPCSRRCGASRPCASRSPGPISASSRSKTATEFCISRVRFFLERSWPTSPAACQVEPCVSCAFSRSSTSRSPARAR